MSANLDKSLDEIIGSNKKPIRRATRGGPKKVSKQINGNRRRGPAPTGPKRGAPIKAASLLDAAYSTKVNVEGLPRDIKQDAVKEFFASQVGGVQRVLLSYNERGLSTGMAIITFISPDKAKRAVEKFNGAPIDGGKSKLRLNMIIDPSKKPLAARITPLPGQKSRPVVKAAKKKIAAIKEKKQEKRPKKAKPEKKSLEQLDQEMADYFEEKKE